MAVNGFEALVRIYFQANGFFTLENVDYHINPTAKIPSDYLHGPSEIDLIAIKPKGQKIEACVVNAKGHGDGLNIADAICAINEGGEIHGRDARKAFRELAFSPWGGALKTCVYQKTGCTEFTHITACIKAVGNISDWESQSQFQSRIKGSKLKLLQSHEIIGFLATNMEKIHRRAPEILGAITDMNPNLRTITKKAASG